MHLNHAIQHQCHKLLLNTPFLKCFYSVDHQAIASSGGGADAVKLHFPLEVHQHVPEISQQVPEILGSFNGLVCVVVKQQGKSYNDKNTKILIWNPSTRESKLLREPNLSIEDFHTLGFAYNATLDDYKIVRIVNGSFIFSYQNTSQVDVYSLKTNSWKVIQDGPHNLPNVFHPRQGCALDGSIYWLAHNSLDVENNMIVGFDLKDEKFRELALPRDLEQEVFTYLKVLGGRLSIFQFRYGDKVVMWRMKEDKKEEWIKIITIDSSSLHCGVPIFMRPVCFLKNGKLLLKFSFKNFNSSKTPRELVLYDFKTNSIENFHIHGISKSERLDQSILSLPGIIRYFEETTYIESFVSPNFLSKDD